MKRNLSLMLAGPSLLVMASAALAQPTDPATSPDPATTAQEINDAAEESGDDAIIITARRRAEDRQSVPSTVDVVTARNLDDFQLLDFEDISQLVSGLTLSSDSSGFNANAQTRGIQSQVTAQGTPTMEMYLNEVPLEPNLMFQGNFDIGQIEVLKGPQGTLRGRSAPSGAMTQTTRRPDLNEFGGSVRMRGDSRGGINVQAALGIPIIQDVLGLRVAGLWNEDNGGGIKSVNNGTDPDSRNRAVRATLRFEPTDTISAVVMYERLVSTSHQYGGILFGPGATGLVAAPGFLCYGQAVPPVGFTCPATASNPAIFAPPNFNGPPLTPEDRMNIQDFIGFTRQSAHIVTAQLDWQFSGQKLSYVGGYSHFNVLTESDSDGNNTAVGVQRNNSRASHSVSARKTHELRLSSEERLFDMLDYTVGAYYGKETGLSASENANIILTTGAFGSPLGAVNACVVDANCVGTLSPFTHDPKYVVGFDNQTPRKIQEKAIFANVMLHIGENTEFSAGGRKVWVTAIKQVNPVPIPGFAAIANPNGEGPCPATVTGATGAGFIVNAPVVGSTYLGTCDVVVTLGSGAPGVNSIVRPIPRTVRKFDPFVYNFSLSHKFTPDLMVYATYGTAWRAGPGPITAAPVCASDVTLDGGGNFSAPDPEYCTKFNFLDPDKSRAIELGIKAAFFDRRLNVAVAVFKQKFSALFIRDGAAVPSLGGDCDPLPVNNVQGGCSVGTGTFTFGAPAKTKGIDVDVSFRVSDDFNFGAVFSWADGKFNDDALLPCRDSDFDGVPDSGVLPTGPAAWVAAGGPFGPALCPAGNGDSQGASTSPPWNVNLRAEYSHQVFTGGRAFIRGLFNYFPRNKNDPNQVAVDGPPADRIAPSAYGILNLFVGLRDEEGAWEITAAANNLLNSKHITGRGLDAGGLISPARFGATATAFGTTTSNNSGYRSISFVDRREFSLSFRYAFGSR